MKNYEVTLEVLRKVIFDNIPFHLAVKSALKNERNRNDSSFRNSITSSSGCVLRHYLVFQEVIKRKYPELDDEKLLLISLGLANHLFSKKFDESDLNKFIKNNVELDGVIEFINSFNDPKTLTPEDVVVDSKKYFSLRYNLPVWIVNMWEKNLGPDLSKKLFWSLNNKNRQYIQIDKNNIDAKSFFEKYSDLKPYEDVFAISEGKDSVKKHPSIKNGDGLNIELPYLYLLNKIDLDFMRGVAIYAASDNDLLLEIYAKIGQSMKLDYLCGYQKHFFDVKELIKKYNLSSISIYECLHPMIETCISKPVHTFFVCPKNSYLKGLMESPDYFLRINQNNLDEIIVQEKQALLEASKQVEENGYLIYFIPSFSKNETRGVVHSFVNDHKEFSIVEEKQHLPFDKTRSMFYYAIMKRELKHD